LLDAARNRFLVKSMSVLQKTLLILGPSTLAEAERAADAVEEHAAILRGLEARDGPAAEMVMRGHIEAALKSRIKSMRGREIPMEEEV
jgi:DNA-binding GntR family transcriptional regulator